MNQNLLIDVIPFKPTLVENKVSGNSIFEVSGLLQRAEAENQNGRVYSKRILERECKNYTENFIKVGNAYGELDHPDSSIVSLKNASHVIKELWWKGNDLFGKIQLLNTPSGNIVKEIIKDGHTIGISSRGTGSVEKTRESILSVQDDFELICWDFVSNPSTHGAFMNKVLREEYQKNNIKQSEKVHNLIREILCQVNECYCDI